MFNAVFEADRGHPAGFYTKVCAHGLDEILHNLRVCLPHETGVVDVPLLGKLLGHYEVAGLLNKLLIGELYLLGEGFVNLFEPAVDGLQGVQQPLPLDDVLRLADGLVFLAV